MYVAALPCQWRISQQRTILLVLVFPLPWTHNDDEITCSSCCRRHCCYALESISAILFSISLGSALAPADRIAILCMAGLTFVWAHE